MLSGSHICLLFLLLLVCPFKLLVVNEHDDLSHCPTGITSNQHVRADLVSNSDAVDKSILWVSAVCRGVTRVFTLGLGRPTCLTTESGVHGPARIKREKT